MDRRVIVNFMVLLWSDYIPELGGEGRKGKKFSDLSFKAELPYFSMSRT